MLKRVALVVAACVVLLHGAALGAPATRRGKLAVAPKIGKAGQDVTISFRLTAPNDVTVRILDGNGNVVRHLASGMVGLQKAAEPLAPRSLSQEIIWDGKDDNGRDVPTADCKVWVGVGMQAKFDKFILWEKDACPRSRTNLYYQGSDGNSYVIQSQGVHLDTIRVFNSEGKFVRQAWPPSLNRPRKAVERLLAGKWGAADWDGNGVPIKICMNSWYLFGTRSRGTVLTTDGYLVGLFAGVGGAVYAIDPDGFPHAWRWRPSWYVRQQTYKTKWHIAAGRDGDFYLADDYHHVIGHFRAKDMTAVNSFTHNGKSRLRQPRFYLGEMGKAGQDEGHFTGPDDVAVDKDGNLCVFDAGKVRVYSKTGQLLKEADKSAFPAPTPVPQAVKDAEKHPRALCFPRFLKVRGDGTLLIMNHERSKPVIQSDVEGKEFKTFSLPWGRTPYHGYSSFDADGNWYVAVSVRKEPQQIWKYSPDGNRAKFGDKDAIVLKEGDDPFELNKGLFVSRDGDIYVVTQTNKWTTKAPAQTGGVAFGDLSARGEEACQTRVDVYRPDGTLKVKGIVKSDGINGVAVDRKGSIYIIDGTMWHGAQMGAVATGRSVYGKQHWPFSYLTREQAKLDPKTQANKRYSLLSRLVKFSPEGGILDNPDGKRQLWDYAGVSGVSPWNCDAECPASQICLDPDERVWVPDSFLYCVKAVDRAGNEMIRIGKYGNEDCKGGGGDKHHPDLKSVIIDPEIPLCYPKGIALYRDVLLISDMFAHRVMRCRLEYEDVKEVTVR